MLKNVIRTSVARTIAALVPPGIMTDKGHFRLWEARGYHITPVRFSEPIPDTRELPETLWDQPSEMVGVEMDEAGQLARLARFAEAYKAEYDAFPRKPTDDPRTFYLNNGTYGIVDAEILYCMVRHYRPRRMIEIGSGNSTLLTAQAIRRNRADDPSYACEFIAVEPNLERSPRQRLLSEGLPELTRLINATAQAVPLEQFACLEADDILFIDSSHILRIGSDVQYLFLEVLPRLRPGVVVQVHDIFLPAEYPRRKILEQFRFINEQYLLQAFLAFNRSFAVLWGGSYMHLRQPESLERAFASYTRNSRPGSFWMRRTS
jgi:predicted O-methyltransferase YrrM